MSTYFTFDKTVKLIISIAIIAGAVWLTGVLKNVLLPFFLACLLSYIIEPVVIYNQQTLGLKRRAPAVVITLGDGIIILFVLTYFFMPIIINEIIQLGKMIKLYGSHDSPYPFLPYHITTFIEGKINFESLIERFEEGKLASWLDRGASVISYSLE